MIWTTQPRSDLLHTDGLSAIYHAADRGADTTGRTRPPVILMLHGVGLRAEAWSAQLSAFKHAGFDVLAPDMPGHGDSAMHTLSDVAAYTATLAGALRRALPDRPLFVMGHSMGAMIAAELPHHLPEQIVGLAALNAIYRREGAAKLAVRQRAAALDGHRLPDPSPTLARWFGNAATSPHGDAYAACKDWLSGVDPKGYQQAYRCFAQADGPDDTQLVTMPCPALFMTGALEPNSTPAMSRAMAAQCPNGQAIVIENAAHMMPMTHADDVNTSTLAFIRECCDD